MPWTRRPEGPWPCALWCACCVRSRQGDVKRPDSGARDYPLYDCGWGQAATAGPVVELKPLDRIMSCMWAGVWERCPVIEYGSVGPPWTMQSLRRGAFCNLGAPVRRLGQVTDRRLVLRR
jgi:hypothetical protein